MRHAGQALVAVWPGSVAGLSGSAFFGLWMSAAGGIGGRDVSG